MRLADIRVRAIPLLAVATFGLLLVPWAAGGNDAAPAPPAGPVSVQAAAPPAAAAPTAAPPAAAAPTSRTTPKPVAATASARPKAPSGKPPKKQLKVSINPKPVVLFDQSRPGKRTVALTFDDGPDPVWTPKVLAALRRNNAVATFCMIGDNVTAHPEMVTAVVNAGMRLCDHTQSHPQPFAAIDKKDQQDQITGGRSALAEVTKAAVPYMRAPGGDWSPDAVTFAVKKRMQPLDWSVDTRDWSLPGSRAIVNTVESSVQPGSIILFHDGGGDRAQTLEALDTLLPWLVDHGYRFTFPTP